ncbi:MAG: methyltransferase domain-containing protein [bacterium]
MTFDYQKSIWGKGLSDLKWSNPARFRLQQSLNAVKSLVQDARVLELGCGAGRFISAVSSHRKDLQCYGCDISESAIQTAKNRNDKVKFQLCASTLPYEDNFFDAVLIFDVLEHVDDPLLVLKEIHRVVKNRGIFYCFVPCENDLFSMWRWLGVKKTWSRLTEKYAGHIQKFSRKQLIEIIKQTGFRIRRIRYSEHIIGQLAGIGVFFAIASSQLKKNKRSVQINNEEFIYNINQRNNFLFSFARKVINIIINIESTIFCALPSPNVHITSIKYED